MNYETIVNYGAQCHLFLSAKVRVTHSSESSCINKMVAKSLFLLALCLHTSLARLFEESDTHALLKEILEKLDEKEARISKLENLVQKQQNRIVDLETEVVAQKQQIVALKKESDSATETQEVSDEGDETNFTGTNYLITSTFHSSPSRNNLK